MVKVTKNTIIQEVDGIIKIKVTSNRDFDLEGMNQHLKVCWDDSKGIPKPVLMDVRELNYISPTTTNYALQSKECNQITKALAFLIRSPTMQIQLILTGIIKFGKIPYPVKIFFNEKKAIEWLKTFKEKKK